MGIGEFISDAISIASKNKIDIHFIAKTKISGCAGYFEPPNLFVATKRSDWLRIFVHEFCHLLQAIDENNEIDPGYPHTTNDEYQIYDDWLMKNIDHDINHIHSIIDRIQLMENNCDIRAVELIKKYNLPINIKNYIKSANAYHLFYSCIKKNRKWYKKSPYGMKKINDLFEDKFITNFDLDQYPEYEKIINENCY